MKFWSDASPIVKIAVVVGVVGIVGVLGFNLFSSPYGDEEVGQQRGITAR